METEEAQIQGAEDQDLTLEGLKRELEGQQLECFDYRHNIKTSGRTEWILYSKRGRLSPAYTKRSRTGAHGEDCYSKRQLDVAFVAVVIEKSSSGRDHSELIPLKKSIPFSVIKNIFRDFKDNYIILNKLSELLNNPEIEITQE